MATPADRYAASRERQSDPELASFRALSNQKSADLARRYHGRARMPVR